MKTTNSPPFLPARRRALGAKLRDVINIPESGPVEEELLGLLKAADASRHCSNNEPDARR